MLPVTSRGRTPARSIAAALKATLSPAEGDNPEKLVSMADQMLYRAKERGRNCIEVALSTMPLESVGS